MRLLRTKTFGRWARKERLADTVLAAAADEMQRGLLDAELGGGLVKKRIPRPGAGKSGGYRVLVALNVGERCVFLYGFAKSERDNVDEKELVGLKRLAQAFLTIDDQVVERLIEAGELTEVASGKSKTA